MKRVFSLIFALIMLFSLFASSALNAYSATKTYAEDKLVEIQKKSGYVPGKSSIVQNNCYGFISKVCEELYGVSYNGEGLYENYKAKHSTGNFKTVATYTTSHKTPTSQDVEDIIAFFLKYAAPGDIIHYGAYDKSVSKTHTVMIQSISNKKMSVYHSNYQIAQNGRETCHIDDIYWDSFRSSPTQHVKKADGTLYSLNAMFYNTMKVGGVGITINRYSKYEDKFYLVGAAIPSVTTSRSSTTSVNVSWNEIFGASKYKIQYKKSSDSSYTTASSSCAGTSIDIKNLTVGTTYNFRVAAYIGTKWMNYSDVVSKKVLPPTLTVIKFSPASNGLNLKWTKRDDITGIRIYKSASSDGTYSKLKTITDNTVNTYLDKKVDYAKTYYYKIERYIKIDGNEYSTTSSPISGSYVLSKPDISFENTSASSIAFNIAPNGFYDSLQYYVTNSSSKNVVALTKTNEGAVNLDNLTVGENYTFNCRQITSLGYGDYTSVTVQAVPRKEDIKSLSATSSGIKIVLSNSDDVSGYKIYRSAQQSKGFSLLATIEDKSVSSYTDGSVGYNTEYYYKIRSFAKSGAKNIYSAYSEIAGPKKNSLSKPKNVSVIRKTPTSVTVSWDEVKYANKYIVEYKPEGGSWSALSATSSKSKVVSKLKLGTNYYFRVKAVNNIGSGSFCAKISKKALPPTPAAPSLTVKESGIKVSWNAKEWATGYKIYRATSKNGTYSLVKTINNGETASWTDKSVKENKGYYYKTVCFVTKSKKTYDSPKSPYSYIKFVK